MEVRYTTLNRRATGFFYFFSVRDNSLKFASCLFFSRRLLCCKRESYGKIAWQEVLLLNTRLCNIEQRHEKITNSLTMEVRRIKDLLEAKEEEERSLKEEMRRLISLCSKIPTEVS